MNTSLQHRSVLLALLAGVAGSPGITRAADLDDFDNSGWFVRLGGVARFNVKATFTGVHPILPTGVYDDGFVLTDNGGGASGKTWNWGSTPSSQIIGNQLVLTRLDGAPNVGLHDINVSNPVLGGELIGGYQFGQFKIGKRTARIGFEIGYGYSGFSEGMNYSANGIATRTTDSYGGIATPTTDGILPPIPPYSGTFAGPGPLLSLQGVPGQPIVSPATTTFQSNIEATMQNFRVGPSLEIDLTKRLSVAFGAGYSSVYADASVRYIETLSFTNPAMPSVNPANTTISHAEWRPGIYAEMRGNYQFTGLIGAFVGGDIQYNKNLNFGDTGHEVTIDLGPTFGAKAGLIFHF